MSEVQSLQNRSSFYVASRASIAARAQMWRSLRDDRGVSITSSWIDLIGEDGADHTVSMADLWTSILSEITSADCLVLYVEPGDFPLKGALVEAGMALAAGKLVRVLTPEITLDPVDRKPLGSWACHPNVHLVNSIEEAVAPVPKPFVRYIR